MNANLIKKTIEMTANEAKAAGKIGSEKFMELRQYQEVYPTFTIVAEREAEDNSVSEVKITSVIKKR